MAERVKQVAVIGAGLIGRGWAIVFARAGWRVRLFDINPGACDAALDEIARQAGDLARHGLSCDPGQLVSRIESSGDLDAAVEGASYVQECGPETLEAKRRLFVQLDAVAPADSVLASSSSGFPTSAFAEGLENRARCLVVHPVNPPHLTPLVELCPASWTAPETLARAMETMESVGQTPIVVKKEIDGFILNRLQGALLNEALRLVDGGYVDPDDLDKTVRDGLGLRWSFMGPFETIDLNAPGGVGDYMERFGPMYARMALTQTVPPDWGGTAAAAIVAARRAHLGVDELKERQRWRDRRLAAVIAHKAAQQD